MGRWEKFFLTCIVLENDAPDRYQKTESGYQYHVMNRQDWLCESVRLLCPRGHG
jgi:hypothetical protein